MTGWARGEESRIKGRTFDRDVLTVDEIERLEAACSSRAPTGIRNRALIRFLYKTGARISEALAVFPKDISINGRGRAWISIHHGKGRKPRRVPISETAREAIDLWLDIRKDTHGITRRRRIFSTLNGDTLSPQYVRTALQRIGRRAGLEKRIHPHGLRRSCACHLLDQGMSVRAIQGILGHSSLATTQAYLQEINPKYLADEMERIDWR